jgi:hypothetical protein
MPGLEDGHSVQVLASLFAPPVVPARARLAFQQIDDVEQRRSKYQEMYVGGVISMPTLQKHVKELDARESAIRSEIAALTSIDERVERLRRIRERMRDNPILAFLAETEGMRRKHYGDIELRVICSGTETLLQGVFGSQTITPISTSATGK